jgi:hypothetical protein
MANRRLLGLVVAAIGVGAAYGDTISPSSYSASIAVGGTATVSKVVTITQTLTAPLDVMFLTDTTGSMGASIGAIRTGFSDIVTALGGVATDPAFAAAEYKDIGDLPGEPGTAYRLNSDITTSGAAVQAAIAAWSASGGGDLPEANLFALQQAASTTGWRAGSQRFLVWTGDAPGHDPSNGVTQAGAIAALNAAGITVFAANAPSGPGIDDTGQATAIAEATSGGSFLGTFDATTIADAITDALTTAITNYSTVELVAVPTSPGLGVSFVPMSHTGSFDRSIDRTFNFDVTFTGVAPGTYNFEIRALVDGRPVAVETDSIVVGGPAVPEPSTYLMLGGGLLALVFARRRRA